MLDHVTISITNIETSSQFYRQTLYQLGYTELIRTHISASYGTANHTFFVISELGDITESLGQARGFHIAFQTPSYEALLAWYSKALEQGAQTVTAPSVMHTAEAFHAIVTDPDGWRLEAIYRQKNR